MLQRILQALKSHFTKDEAKSMAQTFLAVFIPIVAVDASSLFQQIASGNMTKEALAGLGLAVIRSIVKALWSMLMAAYKKPDSLETVVIEPTAPSLPSDLP